MVWEHRRSGWHKRDGDARSNADVDYGRIVHSASFRRLQGKTQILNLGDSDFYRTRLTHSLEVAQVAGSIARQLRSNDPDGPATPHLPDLALIQAVGSTHDLGHPPFGHGGEVALNYCMADSGGFEGNGQTLRILSKLEKYSEKDGADLTRRTLLGTLKYPAPYSAVANRARRPGLVSGTTVLRLIDREWSKPPKCFLDSEADVVDWLLKPLSTNDRERFQSVDRDRGEEHGAPLHKSFDCSIMDVADDVSFGVHDLEDALALGLVTEEDFERHVPPDACQDHLNWMNARPSAGRENDVYGTFVKRLFGNGQQRKHAISLLVGYLVNSCVIEDDAAFEEPLIRYRAVVRPEARVLIKALKALVYKVVIKSPEVQHLEFKGQQMVVSVFEALRSEPGAFLPGSTYCLFEDQGGDPRVICDHVAGMTDTFLMKTFERLFSPRMGSVFDTI